MPMCGIAGFLLRDSSAQVADVQAMCDLIRHRGPDDEGIYTDGPCGIGMRRLSIIDLSTGHQPISNEDGTVWVVFNGEIYNYQELRQDLIARAIASAPTATPKRWFISTRKKAPTACIGCAACLPSASGTRGSARSCWRATASARSRSITRKRPNGFYFASELKCLRHGRRPARSRHRRAASLLPVHLHRRSVQSLSARFAS